jgi:hypothetical protein
MAAKLRGMARSPMEEPQPVGAVLSHKLSFGLAFTLKSHGWRHSKGRATARRGRI